MNRVLAYAPIPALFLAGAFVARLALRDAPTRIAPDRAQPLLVVTAWGEYGALAFALLAATLALATIALFVASSRSGALEARERAIVGAATVCACFAWPFIFSSDVYAYAAYGDLANRGITPYALAPPNLHDALLDAARWQWGGARFPPCVYGPAFVQLARALAEVSSAFALPATTTLATFRLCAMLAYLATIACANVALRSLSDARRARILTLGALNPVVLWSAAEGHNDIYALLVVALFAAAAGIVLRVRSFALLPLAMLVKASAGILAFALVLDALLVERRRARPIVLASLGGLIVTIALALPPLWPVLHALAAHGHYAPNVSLTQLLGPIAAPALGIALVAIALFALGRGRRTGYAWLGLAAVALLPNPYPWYATVLVPLALVDEGTRASRALYAVTICAAIRYLPDAFGNMSPSAAAIASAVQVVPILYALSGLSPRKDLHPT